MAPPHPPPLSLLIVEDDREAIKILNTMIGRKFPDVAIRTAENGAEGIRLCAAHPPDIVITDINMPDMDGIRMTREISATKPDTCFIVISGYSDRHHLEQFRAIACVNYLLKPIDFTKLFAAIAHCIDRIRPT